MKKLIFAICILGLILSGCSSPAANQETLAQTPAIAVPLITASAETTPTGTIPVSAAQQDTATPPPMEAPPVILPANDQCGNPYYPVVDGALWYFSGPQGEFINSLSVGEDGAFTITAQGQNNNFTIEGKCSQDGISLVDAPGDSLSYEGEAGSSSMSTTAIEGMTLPNDMKVGDSWSQTLDVSVSSDGDPIRYTITMDYSIPGSEVVTVPAGTFTTLKIEQSSTLNESPASFQTLWYAQGVGPVKSDIEGVGVSELISYNFP